LRNLGSPLDDFSGIIPYHVFQTLYDAIFPKGRDRCYRKSLYRTVLSDQAIDDVVGISLVVPPTRLLLRCGG